VSGEGWRRGAATLALAVVCYGNTLGNDLVWDDRLTAAAPAGILQRAGEYYRPVVMLSFRAERALFGGAPAARHATNLLSDGASILDAVHEAGYFDQAHLTRSLKVLIEP